MTDAHDVVPLQEQYLDWDRVARSVEYSASFSHSNGQLEVFLVEGGPEIHWVALGRSGHIRTGCCDCGDFIYRLRICKHICAVLALESDPLVTKLLEGE